MSAARFSRDNNLNYHALNYHLRKLRNNKNDTSQLQNFIELPVEKSSKVEMLPEIQINMNSGLLTICFQDKS